jgi:hypothetical protein
VKIARDHAASVRRKEGTARKNGFVGLCERCGRPSKEEIEKRGMG